MGHNGSATPAPGCGVTLADLAANRAISKDAARRLVRSGKVGAHQVAGVHGPEWCVHPDDPPPLRNGDAREAPGVRHGGATVVDLPDFAALVALVDRLQVENRQLAEAAAVWQERARVLSDQLALTAPQSPPGASEATESPEPTPELSRHWWRSWGLWVAAILAVFALAVLGAWPR